MSEEKDDLKEVKPEEAKPAGEGQPAKEPLTPEEVEAIKVENAKLKEDLAKAEEEKGNYKQGLISKVGPQNWIWHC
jgi:hypothetical protein